MTIKSLFRVVYGLFLLLVLAIAVVSGLLLQNQQRLLESQRIRFESYLVADELRQSSDDLTRFVRTYVVTGNPIYEKYYWQVLAIRNGREPRPPHYERIYWDLVTPDRPLIAPNGPKLSLRQRMKQLGFTDKEFAKLQEAQANSDALVKTENIAMHAMKGLYDDGTGKFTRRSKPDQAMAIRILHDASYHRDKARIMKPIDDFFAMLDTRTAAAMRHYESRSNLYLSLIILMLGLLLALTLVSSLIIGRRVTRPVGLLQEQARTVALDIDRLADVIRDISEGSLASKFTRQTVPLQLGAADEVGGLAARHNHIIDRLQEAGEAIAHITANMGETTRRLNSANAVLGEKNQALQESNTRLQELEALRDSLTHMIIHDMRTPLTSIYGYLLSLQMYESGGLSPEGQEFFSAVISSTRNLIDLVSSLLDISKMESGEMKLDIEDVNLAWAAALVLDEIEPLKENRQITIAASDAPAAVPADPRLLRRILQNLLDNALKYTASNGEILVTIKTEADQAKVSVKDNGSGIPAKYQDRIFEKFGQGEAPAQQRRHSTGLGLHFCKLAVEAHGGKIGLDSELGEGSNFWFTLPLRRG
jgi:signal transduction histidine kinase